MPNPDCQCLPCTLDRALAAWKSKHFLSSEGMIDQLGRFVSKAISKLPEYEGQTIGVALMQELKDGTTERFH